MGTMLIDSLPLCDFAFPQLVRPMENRETWCNAEDISGDLDLDLRLFAAVSDTANDGPDKATWGAGLTVVYPSWNFTAIQEAIGVGVAYQIAILCFQGIHIGDELGHGPHIFKVGLL